VGLDDARALTGAPQRSRLESRLAARIGGPTLLRVLEEETSGKRGGERSA